MEPPAEAQCPACRERVAFVATPGGKTCPKCGRTFDVGTGGIGEKSATWDDRRRITWWVLLGSLLAPAALTVLAALVRSDELGVITTLLGSGAAALFGGIWLAVRVNLHPGLRILMGFVLVPVFYVGSVALCFAGCALGGGGVKF